MFKRIIAAMFVLAGTTFAAISVSFFFVAFNHVAFAQVTPAPITVSYDFRSGWQAGFADYPPVALS
jgi:hypothetical protein